MSVVYSTHTKRNAPTRGALFAEHHRQLTVGRIFVGEARGKGGGGGWRGVGMHSWIFVVSLLWSMMAGCPGGFVAVKQNKNACVD